MLVGVLFVLSAVLCAQWIWKQRRFFKLNFEIPGPFAIPPIGLGLEMLRNKGDILRVLEKYERVHGGHFYTWFGPYPVFVVAEPQMVKEILLSPNCLEKTFLYDIINITLGDGILNSKNPDWSANRKLMNHFFSPKSLLSFLPIFNQEADSLSAEIRSFVGIEGGVNLSEKLFQCSFKISSQTTFGRQENGESMVFGRIYRIYYTLMHVIIQMFASPWLRYKVLHQFDKNYLPFLKAKEELLNLMHNLIRTKCRDDDAQIDKISSETTNTFIDRAISLAQNRRLSWESVQNESNILIVAATETTSKTIGNTLMLLAMFPEYQEKAFDELKSIFPDGCDTNFEVDYDNIRDMVYLDMVLNETMRVIASAPLAGRTVTTDFQLANGVILPQGLQIAIDIFNLHRSEDVWGPGAKTFNPDNFLPANVAGRHPFAFIPFTKGIRNCIGWRFALYSAKIILAKLLRKYRFSTQFKLSDLQFMEGITIQLKTVPLLQVHLRDS